MNLASYIKAKGMKRNEFASAIGVSPTIVTQWCAGDAWPSAEMAERIFAETDGEVTPNDFLHDRLAQRNSEDLVNAEAV